jgi:outer membrane protein W
MKKFASIFCLASFFVLTAFGFAAAQDVANTIGVGARVLYYFPQGDEFFDTDAAAEEDIALGLNFTYIVIPNFSLELAWDYFKTDIEESGFEWAEITTTPFLLTAQFRILPEGPVVPYAGAGVGYYINELDKDSGAKEEAQATGVSYPTGIDDSLGLHLNAGLDWFLTDNFALNLDTRYFWVEADIEGKEGSSSVSSEVDLDSLVIGIGGKLYF